MKLFKLVLTGIATLICVLLVIIKRTKGFAASFQHYTVKVDRRDAETGTINNCITDYPYNSVINLGY
jgi:hypothetical protein